MAMNVTVLLDLDLDAVDDLEDGIQNGLERTGDFLVRYGKRLAPVDTGTFMRSIDWAWTSSDHGKLVFGSSDVPGKVLALEHGHSGQAPSGVFEVSVKRNRRKIKAIMAESITEEMGLG